MAHPAGNPFHTFAPGTHVTDEGLRYLVTDDTVILEPGAVADVHGAAFAYQGWGHRAEPMWPSVLIELNLPTGDDNITGDRVAEVMTARGLRRAQQYETPPRPDTITWTVRRQHHPQHGSGIFAPGPAGEPHGWYVMRPMPDIPEPWNSLVDAHDQQCGIYLTTDTYGISYLGGEAWTQRMDAAINRGTLWGTRALVVS